MPVLGEGVEVASVVPFLLLGVFWHRKTPTYPGGHQLVIVGEKGPQMWGVVFEN